MSDITTDFQRIMREEARLIILKALAEQVNGKRSFRHTLTGATFSIPRVRMGV